MRGPAGDQIVAPSVAEVPHVSPEADGLVEESDGTPAKVVADVAASGVEACIRLIGENSDHADASRHVRPACLV